VIKFRVQDLQTIEISGTDVELGLLAEDLTDISDGRGAWVAVTGDVAPGDHHATRFANTVIFRTTEGPASLVVAADAMIECRLPLQLLQRVLDAVQGTGGAIEAPAYIQDPDLEIRVICTGEEAA
jgi:hypothetical protein